MPEVNKWHLLQDIVLARRALDLKNHEIAVLEALLSFIPGKTFGDAATLVVYPANATICSRLNGMPCSTMRRHLAKLVRLGLIARRDSPNGKRYQRSYGEEVVAYGFDLSPLLHRLGEIRTLAEAARTAQAALAAQRESIALQRRDLIALLDPAQPCEALTELNRALRRNLTHEELQAISEHLQTLISAHSPAEDPAEAQDMSTTDAQSEQQYQNTIINHFESVTPRDHQISDSAEMNLAEKQDLAELRLVLSTCTQVQTLSSGAIRCWQSLQRSAETLYPMMGISPKMWFAAKARLGAEKASAVVAGMLERFDQIRSPNAYLQSLIHRASLGIFRFKAMFIALARRPESSQL